MEQNCNGILERVGGRGGEVWGEERERGVGRGEGERGGKRRGREGWEEERERGVWGVERDEGRCGERRGRKRGVRRGEEREEEEGWGEERDEVWMSDEPVR